MDRKHENRKKITFTIDGVSHTTRDDDKEAADLIRLAGLDPSLYDLARLKGGGATRRFRDSEVLELRDGDAFVTVRQSAQVA